VPPEVPVAVPRARAEHRQLVPVSNDRSRIATSSTASRRRLVLKRVLGRAQEAGGGIRTLDPPNYGQRSSRLLSDSGDPRWTRRSSHPDWS
jgi:hypothetical protein